MIARETDAGGGGGADITAKQEINTALTLDEKTSTSSNSKAAANSVVSTTGTTSNITSAATSSSTSWTRLKDPRIVRVSRAFGGKDRHSKVCTVRGLRDRRVRLSVPTAIQLYDLQDRLGLSQPSKVVDWLLNAAKQEIDELPPLQIPPNSGTTFTATHNTLQPLLSNPHHHHLGVAGSHHDDDQVNITRDHELIRIGASSINWGNNQDHYPSEHKSKELIARLSGDSSHDQDKETTWIRSSHDQAERGKQHSTSNNYESSSISHGGGGGAYFSSNNFFSRSPQNLGLLNNTMPTSYMNSLIRWDPSNLSLSQSRSPPGLSTTTPGACGQPEDHFHNFSVLPLPSGAGHQVLVYQPAAAAGNISTTHSYFPSHLASAATVDYAQKQIEFQMLNSSSSAESAVVLSNRLAPPARVSDSLHLLSTNTNLLNSQNDRERKKDDDKPWQ